MEKPFVKLVIMGDSIADCGRARPVGEGSCDSLGNGYVRLLDAMAKTEHPDWRLRIVNMGTSGDRSRDLCARWETDCLALAPDWVLIAIGINDVWRHFDAPLRPELHVSADEYADNLQKMAASARDAGSGVLFASPYFLEPCRDVPMRAMTDTYRARMAAVAQSLGAPYADLQTPFEPLLQSASPYLFSADRVHPNTVAQYVIARETLRLLERVF